VTTSHTLSSTFTALMEIKETHKKNRRLKLILKRANMCEIHRKYEILTRSKWQIWGI
jgi:hypothetical protein